VGKKTGPNPTDRAKSGVKRSLLTDGRGVPLGVEAEGANRNDFKMARETLESVPVERPEPTEEEPQHLSMDKGYDYDEIRELAQEFGYTTHLRERGEDTQATKREVGKKARRWVVERTHSWMNLYRAILIRWEKKPVNYLGLLHLTCALITFHCLSLPG
jgi:putative transposase